MAAADTYAPEYYEQPDTAAEHLIPRVVKRNIYDSGGTNNHLAESGDKYYVGKLPVNCRPWEFKMATKNLDTNAAPTLSIKLVLSDGTTTHTLLATSVVGVSGAYQKRESDNEAMWDVLDNSDDADWELWIESTANAATATSTSAEVAVAWSYFMDRGGSDPA